MDINEIKVRILSNVEMRLLSQAMRYRIGRVGNPIVKVAGAIENETQLVAPLARSCYVVFLDPKLHIQVIQDSRCNKQNVVITGLLIRRFVCATR